MHLGSSLSRTAKRGRSGGVQKQNMRQRKLFEYDIPRTTDLPIRKRDGFKLQLNAFESAIVIDDEEEDSSNHCSEKQIGDEDLVEIVDPGETFGDGDETKGESSYHVKPSVQGIPRGDFGPDAKCSSQTGSNCASAEVLIDTDIVFEGLDREIRCPLCNIDLTDLELYAREAHCASCLHEESATPQQCDRKLQYPIPETRVKSSLLAKNALHPRRDSSSKETKNTETKSTPSMRSRRRNLGTNKADKKVVRRTKRAALPKLPSVKVLTFHNGFKLVVDGFNFASEDDISIYFLSHFHSDHYIGLKKSWNQGIIYCSPITAALVKYKFKIPDDLIRAIADDEPTWITPDIKVTAFDANHCPGSQVYLFQEYMPQGNDPNDCHNEANVSKVDPPLVRQFIHTGDFRANKILQQQFQNDFPIDAVYLDTTYLSHCHRLPSQREVVVQTAKYVRQFLEKRDLMRKRRLLVGNNHRNKLILVGAYSIGKERLALEICAQLGGLKCAVYNNELRSLFMDCGSVMDNCFSNGCEDCIMVHLVPLGYLKDEANIMKYLKNVVKISWLDVDVIGIVPTGWTYNNIWKSKNERLSEDAKRKLSLDISNGNDPEASLDFEWFDKQVDSSKKFQIFKVPYSEHSSFDDLVKFATCGEFKWDRIVATVNLHDPRRVTDMQEWFRAWKSLNDAKYARVRRQDLIE